MKDKEVLQKAIEIAIENGMSMTIIDEAAFYSVYMQKTRRGTAMIKDYKDVDTKKCYGVIFSHDFAKAFWKETIPTWRVHLQNMVICDNPIDYLRKFIIDNTANTEKK
jgi:hypothetical protein